MSQTQYSKKAPFFSVMMVSENEAKRRKSPVSECNEICDGKKIYIVVEAGWEFIIANGPNVLIFTLLMCRFFISGVPLASDSSCPITRGGIFSHSLFLLALST